MYTECYVQGRHLRAILAPLSRHSSSGGGGNVNIATEGLDSEWLWFIRIKYKEFYVYSPLMLPVYTPSSIVSPVIKSPFLLNLLFTL